MPRSPLRRKVAFTPPPVKSAVRVGNPRWLVPVMLACFVIGLLWVVIFYLSEQRYPIQALHSWNMGVGFAFIIVGFILSTRWR